MTSTSRPDLQALEAEVDELGTRQRVRRPTLASALGWVRWAWYSLTSMRTALILLFLLALAAIPGSIIPQRGSANPSAVRDFVVRHPTLAPVLDHLGFFNVYGSPWFAAVYLLLFISLAGCVVPRARRHWEMLRAAPPATPRNLYRLPAHQKWTTELPPQQAVREAAVFLRTRRFRIARHSSSVAAERGYLRETGNLLFHSALLVVLLGIAVTSGFGFTGTVLLKEHDSFADTQIAYDSFSPGRMVDVGALPPFTFRLDDFHASFVRSGPTRGAAAGYQAEVTYTARPGVRPKVTTVTVNHPLSVDGVNVYLTGHGYAPHFLVRDGSGRSFDETVPFLPRDGVFTSQGVVKLPDARPHQLGISGFFLPTAAADPFTGQPISVFPAPDNPAVVLGVFSGDLGLDSGVPQSVYTLDTSRMKLLAKGVLRPGQTLTLPGGQGSVTFLGFSQFAEFQLTKDPGKPIVLGAICAAIAGLLASLGIRRWRVWVRAEPDDTGRTVVEVGGLPRTDASGGFAEAFDRLVAALRTRIPPEPAGPAPFPERAGSPSPQVTSDQEG
ncbi:MAG: cytochrome c biogenesis protein ResB, partial [Acidothermus sp.]|nr:cytochrome c biogenesis protein ResB [Acidothermus sp.]